MIYTHVLNRAPSGVRSPADRLALSAAPMALGISAEGRPLRRHPGLDSVPSGATALLPRPAQQRGDRRPGEMGPRPD